MIGGAVVMAVAGSINSMLSGSGGLLGAGSLFGTSTTSLSSVNIEGIVFAFGAFGVVSGLLIIVGGVQFSSPIVGRRKLGFVLVLLMLLLGGIATGGGLVIGFFLAAAGLWMGWGTWPHGAGMSVAMTPMGPMPVMSGGATQSQPTGPTNYCKKCGSKLRGDEIFCASCGQRVYS